MNTERHRHGKRFHGEREGSSAPTGLADRGSVRAIVNRGE